MQKLSKEIKLKIETLNSGKLTIDDLEITIDKTKELYERLIVLRYKFYEKKGSKKQKKEVLENKSIPKSSQQQIHF